MSSFQAEIGTYFQGRSTMGSPPRSPSQLPISSLPRCLPAMQGVVEAFEAAAECLSASKKPVGDVCAVLAHNAEQAGRLAAFSLFHLSHPSNRRVLLMWPPLPPPLPPPRRTSELHDLFHAAAENVSRPECIDDGRDVISAREKILLPL